jgi:hypothetical protein
MHEHVHERAQQERQPDQHTQDVGAVLREQQRAGNDEEAEQNQSCPRGEKSPLMALLDTVGQQHGILQGDNTLTDFR